MSVIKKYTKKDGTTAYMFNVYLGVDPLTGKKKRTTRRGFQTSKEAKLALSKILVEVDDYGLRSDENITFEMVYREWFKQHKKEVKPTTEETIKMIFKRILPKFGHLRMKDITRSYCQKVINEWAEELKSFNEYKVKTNQVFKYAVRANILKTNPMEYVTLPKSKNKITFDLEKNESQKYYSKDELKEFLEVVSKDKMAFTMFRLLAYTGARKGEIHALHWSDINFKDKTIHFKKSMVDVGGKKLLQTTKTVDSNRVISVDDETLRILKQWRKEQIQRYMKVSIPFMEDEKQPIFTIYKRKEHKFEYCYKSFLYDKLKRLYKKHKHLPQISVHGFRHTHASLLFEAGARDKEIQTRLGHSDIQTTMNIYTHATNRAKEKTADLFQTYMSL